MGDITGKIALQSKADHLVNKECIDEVFFDRASYRNSFAK